MPVKRQHSFSPDAGTGGHASPNLKRVKSPAKVRSSTATKTLSMISWNIETPAPYLAANRKSLMSGSLARYFKTLPTKQGSSEKKQKSDSLKNGKEKGPPSLREIVEAHGWPSLFCLQEVRALQRDSQAVRELKNALRSPSESISISSSDSEPSSDTKKSSSTTAKEPSYTAQLSLCQSKTGGKRFGVATYISSHLGYQYTAREVDWDEEGRLLLLTFYKLKLCVINVYALNGSENPWKDPKTGEIRGTRNERKREFNRLLMEECRTTKDQGFGLVLIGDFNISREARDCFPRLRTEYPHSLGRKEFNETFIPSLDLVDIFRELHGDKRSYSWFSPHKPDGSDAARVDFALVSRELVPYVTKMEYLEDKKWRFKSDHAPMRLELDVGALDSAKPG